MKLWDISRELLSAPVYPGDPSPAVTRLQQMTFGDTCNLTALSMCAHNGTHLDAPRHFVPDGDGVDAVALTHCCGPCRVIAHDGVLTGDTAEELLAKHPAERVLFKGDVTVDTSAAYVLTDAGVRLVGVELPSVAAADRSEAVHRHLLGSGVLILEGLDLSTVPEGPYFLFAAPLKIAEGDGAPVRAVLVDDEAIDVEPAFRKW